MISNQIWLSIDEVCSLTNFKRETLRRKCKAGEFNTRFEINGKFKIYYISLNSLPEDIQQKYEAKLKGTEIKEEKIIDYSNAPKWAKDIVDKYLELFNLTRNMGYYEKIQFLQEWGERYPNKKISYSALMEAKKKFDRFGVEALMPKYGVHRKGICKIETEHYEYFKNLYLREGAPSAKTSWAMTLGRAKIDGYVEMEAFPSCKTFLRKLRQEIPEQAIYLARFGQTAWNRKYASYIPRDYSSLKAGECWVSDHAQIDVAVDCNGTVCFPWVTVFRDAKTSKWLGWFLHPESPNSDHIFQAFYYGVLRFGLPNDVYLDNGKDYRCKDFAGGRSTFVKVKHHNKKENSLLTNLGITVHFALPYNAQTKPVERDFLKIKTFLSKGFIGYRGGKITERPEKLRLEIKNNEIMNFADFKVLFDKFIKEYLNVKPSKGKALQGKCPDELWFEEFKVKKVMGKEALRLFCMRTSRSVSIGRNGVKDSQLQINYWDDWMIAYKGRKVFLRRDINAFQEAWVFDAKTEEYLGKGYAQEDVAYIATTNIEKAVYKKKMEQKRKEKKILQDYINVKYSTSNEEMVEDLIASLDKKEYVSNPKISKISNTKMDQVIKLDKKMDEDIPKYVSPIKPKQTIYLTESEKRRALAQEAI